ncbi:MAG: hypothetical protein WCK90_04930 [archaeon]
MEVLLDSSFIISCVRKKIDFMDSLAQLGFRIILPREVFQELRDLRTEVSREDRIAIDLALLMIETKGVKKMKLGGKTVDDGLITRGRQGAYIATLDNGIKKMIPNKVGISASKNDLEIFRD